MDYIKIYVGANLICIFLLGIILYNDLTKFTRQDKQNLFDQTIVMQILYMAADSAWALIDGKVIKKTGFSMGLINCIVYLLILGASYAWYVYSEARQRDVFKPEKIRSLFFEILIVLSALTMLFGFLLGHGYWIDEDGAAQYLPFYLAVMMVPLLFIVTASVKAFIRAGKTENSFEKREFVQAGMYPLVFVIAGILQLTMYRVPVLCFGCVIGILIVYINNLYGMISADPLTQLNNRAQLQRYLSGAVRNLEEDTRLYIIMLDIDRFKTINDTYGHVEGDRALMVVALELKAVCRTEKNRAFISRYGGDEFVMVTRAREEEEVLNLVRRINLNLEDRVLRDKLQYPIHISAGYAYFLGEGDTPTACLRRADEEMYKEKKRNHIKR